jgi:hypothetical protein
MPAARHRNRVRPFSSKAEPTGEARVMDGVEQVVRNVGQAVSWLAPWLTGITVLAGSALVALVLYNASLRLLGRVAVHFGEFPRAAIERARGPVATILLSAVLGATLPTANFSPNITDAIAHILLIFFMFALGWAANNGLSLASTAYLRRFHTDVEDNLHARKHVTQPNLPRLKSWGSEGASCQVLRGPRPICIGVRIRCSVTCSRACRSPLPSRSGSRTLLSSKASGAGSSRSPARMW